jgi:hypothetical protein
LNSFRSNRPARATLHSLSSGRADDHAVHDAGQAVTALVGSRAAPLPRDDQAPGGFAT